MFAGALVGLVLAKNSLGKKLRRSWEELGTKGWEFLECRERVKEHSAREKTYVATARNKNPKELIILGLRSQ